jgi:hypothetical protein
VVVELADDEMLLTILLRHDQSQNLEQIQQRLAATQWWDRFPPAGIDIVSWHVVMGIGQIVTLKVPAHRLAEVNVEVERSAWGVFDDFVPVRQRLADEWRARRRVDNDNDNDNDNDRGAS